MKKFFLLPGLFILLLLHWHCRGHAGLPAFRTSLPPDSDGVVRDISDYHRSDTYQVMMQKSDSSLGLESLQNGYDGIQVRIWDEMDPSYYGHLLVISHDGTAWQGGQYFFRDTFDNGYAGSIILDKSILKRTDQEWDGFVRRLISLGIDGLPDYSRIPEYHLNADEGGVLVELAQKNFYKIYQYPTPAMEDRIAKFKEVRRLLRILEEVNREFPKGKPSVHP